jgi:photosystem II stability/assembly factor-like uncharacterized protein
MTRSWSILVATLVCLQATAEANGRFPQTVDVHVQPGDDQVILLAATFGLLISRDGGATFRWVCEETIGYGGIFDPDYAMATDGTIFATTFEGLRVSRDGGCTWLTIADLSSHWVQEVEVGPDGVVWAATASSNMPNDVFLSTDNGQSFQATNVPVRDVFWKSLRVAADGQRVYISGYKVAESTDGGVLGPQAFVLRSDDRGASWTQLPLTDVELGSQAWFFVEGVSPTDPDVVFARSLGVNSSIGDALYRSSDAGQSWVRVLDTANRMVAFVIRKNGEVVVGTETDGVHISASGGDAGSFIRMETPQMRCVAENSAGELLACGANWEPDFFALGRSQDGQDWQKVFRFSEIDSAYPCEAGTTQYDICEAKRWPALCEMFQCKGTGPLPADAGADAGTGDGGKGGCCDASPGAARSSAVLAMLLLLLWTATGRRRRI